MAAFSTETPHDLHHTPSWKWASTKCEQFLVLNIKYSWHRTDICVPNRTIDSLYWWIHNILQEKHRFQNNRFHTLQNMPKEINGCWIHDFDKIELLNSKNKRIIYIYSWTHCATSWHPTQFRWDRRLPSNSTRIDSSGVWANRTAKVLTVRFRPRPGPDLSVHNRC